MADWTLEKEQRQKEYRDLQTRRRASRIPENSFYQIPQSPHRSYNQDGRCVYVPDVVPESPKEGSGDN